MMKGTTSVFAIISALFFAFAITSCGIKGDPIPLEKTSIPAVQDLQAVLMNGVVKLSWTPSLKYNDQRDLELRSVEIYRLTEDLSERLAELQENEEKQKRERMEAGIPEIIDVNESIQGPLSMRIKRIERIPASRFNRDAVLVGTLPIEQMIENASGGKLFWTERFPGDFQELPTTRYVYAIKEVDTYGKKSLFSNPITLLPLRTVPSPADFQYSLSQDKVTLLWTSPQRRPEELSIPLSGYRLYKASEDEPFGFASVNTELLPTEKPVEWESNNVISFQRISGSQARYACLLVTNQEPENTGIRQTIYTADEIDSKIGTNVTLELIMSAVAGSGEARIILDGSINPTVPTIVKGSDIFREEENPLIQVEQISLSTTRQKYTFEGKVPVGAIGYVLRIEPRGESPISGSFIVESIKMTAAGSEQNLIKNGDFNSFTALNYEEPVTSFGIVNKYRITAVYSIGGLVTESAPSITRTVEVRDNFPPDAPTGVRAQASFNSITLSWSSASATDLKGYIVYRRVGEQTNWEQITPEPILQTLFQDTNVQAGTVYYYRIESVDSSNNVSSSKTVVNSTVLSR